MKNQFSTKTRIDIIGTIKVDGANPNGDPLMGNAPRTDPFGHGEMSDVCLKHNLRSRVPVLSEGKDGFGVFITPTASDDRTLDAKVSEFTTTDGINVDALLGHYYDVRAFGAVLISSSKETEDDAEDDGSATTGKAKPKKPKKAAAENGAATKAKKNTDHVNGCVTVTFAKSLEPIVIQELSITRCAVQSEKEKEKGNKSTFGTKHIVSNATYRFAMSVNARRAKQNHFSDEDLALLIQAVRTMFVDNESAARPAGSMDVSNMFVVSHESIDGEESVMKTYSRLTKGTGDTFEMDMTKAPTGISVARIV